MTILELLEGLRVSKKTGPLDIEVKGIAYDSRLVEKDFLFVAVKGFTVDGHDYIKDALSRGSAAMLVEEAVVDVNIQECAARSKAAYVEVPDSREALALISSAFYGNPSGKLSLIGITGTNGKTTTSFIVKNIIDAGGHKSGLLGTICYMSGNNTVTASNTTPESLDLQRYLSEMVESNLDHAVLEVSSHALALSRVKGCTFKTAAFTSFTQDHLDFHGTMDEYFRVKSSLFSYLNGGGTAVLNHDDPMISRLETELGCDVITYGIEEGAMIRAENIKDKTVLSKDGRHEVPCGLSFDVVTPTGTFEVSSKFMGRFNVYNILASIGIAYSLNINEDVIRRGIAGAMPVPGRFENIDMGQNFLCIIDYAHTEDALRKLIEEAEHITAGRIITVFGCGGDRDRSKRPLMGYTATELSDMVVITSDNPRTENPEAIIRDIIDGIKKHNYTVCPDRQDAINQAVSMAKEGDSVLIAGKGHEDYQETGGSRHYFSDRECVKQAIKERLGVSR
jgi:UDP-N-acetylmuramoyl-L-alanyl-D-glutamate--2,6-diaminopimelate ligase